MADQQLSDRLLQARHHRSSTFSSNQFDPQCLPNHIESQNFQSSLSPSLSESDTFRPGESTPQTGKNSNDRNFLQSSIMNGDLDGGEDSQIQQWRNQRLQRLEQFNHDIESLGNRFDLNTNQTNAQELKVDAIQDIGFGNYRHEQQMSQETYQLSLSNSRNNLMQMPLAQDSQQSAFANGMRSERTNDQITTDAELRQNQHQQHYIDEKGRFRLQQSTSPIRADPNVSNDLTKDIMIEDGAQSKSPPLDYIEEEFHLTKTTEALQDQLAQSRFALNNQNSGSNEIMLPPSHNVFDQNQLCEAKDVEISNYISKATDIEGSREPQNQLNAYQRHGESYNSSEPTYNAIENEKAIQQDVCNFEFKIGNMRAKLDRIRSNMGQERPIDKKQLQENINRLDQEMIEQAQREKQNRQDENLRVQKYLELPRQSFEKQVSNHQVIMGNTASSLEAPPTQPGNHNRSESSQMMHSLDTFQSRLDRIRHNLAQTDTINKQSTDNFTIKRQSYQQALVVSPSQEEPTELEWTQEKKELSEHKASTGIDQEGLRRRNQELRSMDMPQPLAQISHVTNHSSGHSRLVIPETPNREASASKKESTIVETEKSRVEQIKEMLSHPQQKQTLSKQQPYEAENRQLKDELSQFRQREDQLTKRLDGLQQDHLNQKGAYESMLLQMQSEIQNLSQQVQDQKHAQFVSQDQPRHSSSKLPLSNRSHNSSIHSQQQHVHDSNQQTQHSTLKSAYKRHSSTEGKQPAIYQHDTFNPKNQEQVPQIQQFQIATQFGQSNETHTNSNLNAETGVQKQIKASDTEREMLKEQVQLLEAKLMAFKRDAADQNELKKLRQALAQERQENLQIKKGYERSCAQMKMEFEKIKDEMVQTWKDQQHENEMQILSIKADCQKRLEDEKQRNEVLTEENHELRQKMARIKDLFSDVERKGSRTPGDGENRNLVSNHPITRIVKEGPSNRSTSRVRHSSDNIPVNISLPNQSNTKLVNVESQGFLTHKNSMIRGEPVPNLPSDQFMQYHKAPQQQANVHNKKKKQSSAIRPTTSQAKSHRANDTRDMGATITRNNSLRNGPQVSMFGTPYSLSTLPTPQTTKGTGIKRIQQNKSSRPTVAKIVSKKGTTGKNTYSTYQKLPRYSDANNPSDFQ